MGKSDGNDNDDDNDNDHILHAVPILPLYFLVFFSVIQFVFVESWIKLCWVTALWFSTACRCLQQQQQSAGLSGHMYSSSQISKDQL